MREKKMKWLNKIVFCVALLEWRDNAVGTLASLWATVVLLGGFCSLLSPKDFWFSTVMIFVQATRVFIRNDALVSQWLFGSTRAFRWENFSLRPMSENPTRRNLNAMFIGMCISDIPAFRPEIVTSIIKVALLVIITQILSRRLRGRVAKYLLIFLGIAAYCGGTYGFYKTIAALRPRVKIVKIFGLVLAWDVGTGILAWLARVVIRSDCACPQKARGLIPIKVITALSLACLPFLQVKLGSYYEYISRSIAIVLLILNTPKESLPDFVERHAHFFQIVDTIMPILYFWSVMFPLPGISLKLSFYMLFSAIADWQHADPSGLPAGSSVNPAPLQPTGSPPP